MIVSDQRVADFIGKELEFGVFPPWTAMGVEKDGEVIGGVLFNCFEGSDLHVTVAGRGFGKNFLQNVGDYVYNQLGCARMTIQTEKDSIVGIATRMGGKVEGRLRDHFGKGRDAIIIGILRDEYRYLQKED